MVVMLQFSEKGHLKSCNENIYFFQPNVKNILSYMFTDKCKFLTDKCKKILINSILLIFVLIDFQLSSQINS